MKSKTKRLKKSCAKLKLTVRNMDVKDVLNIPMASGSIWSTEPAIQSNFKSKKKQLCSEKCVPGSSSDHHYLTNNRMECDSEQDSANRNTGDDLRLIDSEKKTKGYTDDQIQYFPQGKKPMDGPMILDTRSDSITYLNYQKFKKFPKILKQTQRSNENISYADDLLRLATLPTAKNASVIVAKSIKPQESTSQNSQQKQASSKSLNVLRNRSVDHRSNRTDTDVTKLHNIPQQNVQQHATPRKLRVYCIKNTVIVIMESKSSLCFTGKLTVKVAFGAVEVYGSILNRSSDTTKVYSPRGYSNVAIETSEVSTEDSIEDAWTTLTSIGITRDSESVLQADVDSVQAGTAILILQNFENGLTSFLKTYFPSFRLFPSINNPCFYSWTDPKRAEIVLQAKLHLNQQDNSNYRRLITDSCITTDIVEKILSNWRANEWSCAMITGGKSVGKSTSVRCLINRLLCTSGKVVLVDVDPGQAECTPAGCISYSLIEKPLMGPNFTHLGTPVYQLFLDEISVAKCVTRYMEGVKMLAERLQQCPILSRLPIVVNTMGFTAHLGWDIAMFTIKLIRPTIILQITSRKKNNFQDYLSAEVVNSQECRWMTCDKTFMNWDEPCKHDLCILPSQAERHRNELNMQPYQQRELVMISYLSGIVCDKDDIPQHNAELLSFNINKVTPYTSPFSSLCIIPQRLFGVPSSHVLSIINGNIVALCGIDLTEESSQESRNIGSLRVLTHRSSLCTCYGFGIIRGIDMEQQMVFINTPLPLPMMQHVNCLAGCIPVPSVLLQLNQGAPYVGENASLPTSREVRRVFRINPRIKYKKKSNKPE